MGFCRSLHNCMPYATLVAFILCVLGLIIFSIGLHRHYILWNIMIKEVLNIKYSEMPTVNLIFIFVVIATAVLAVIILIAGIMATGDSRSRAFNVWKVRLGGQGCFLNLIILTTIFFLIWLAALCSSAIWLFALVLADHQCERRDADQKCLLITHVWVLVEDVEKVYLCNDFLEKKFCKDYLEKAIPAWLAAGIGNFLVFVGLVMFLTCLSSNYAKIRCQTKYEEVSELRRLEGDLHNSRERF